jgi:hypothetical protein
VFAAAGGVAFNDVAYGSVPWIGEDGSLPWLSATSINAYGDLLAFSLRSASFLSDPEKAKLSFSAQLVQLLLRLAGPFFAFLVTLAIRRKLRR